MREFETARTALESSQRKEEHRIRPDPAGRFRLGVTALPSAVAMNSSPQHAFFRPALAAMLALCSVVTPVHAQSPAMGLQPSAQDTPEPAVPIDPVAPAQVVGVPAWLDALLHERVIEATTSREKRLEKLVQLLFGPDALAIQYDGSVTRTIAEAGTDHRANCLSFALMFVTLARRAGIDAYVQETDHVLAWQGNGMLYGNGHVNVGVRIGHTRKTVDIDSSVMSIRGLPRAISDQRALSHYYNNRGAELMATGRLQDARRHLALAIELTPDFIGAWNNLGVLASREGQPAQAQLAYERALEINARHSPTLSNIVNLYRRLGDAQRRAEYEKRLFRVQHRDPFHQIILAMGYEQAGNYAAAIEHYQRAVRLKANDDFVYFGLARAYAHLGDIPRALDALTHARDAAGNRRGNMYQSKLERLRQLHPALAQ